MKAAMPSLHFGYSLLIGLTILTIPLPASQTSPRRVKLLRNLHLNLSTPSLGRILLTLIGFLYPTIILLAIIATANHFILDAVAGALVCGVAWFSNSILLNMLPLEDYFLWCVRIHKPEKRYTDNTRRSSDYKDDGEENDSWWNKR